MRSKVTLISYFSTGLYHFTTHHPVPLSTGEWLLSFWDAHLEAKKNLDPKLRPFEAIVEEGEMIFVPHGFWHMVVNLDDCIAITQNYVSTSNLGDCLKFLREKPDQISGESQTFGTRHSYCHCLCTSLSHCPCFTLSLYFFHSFLTHCKNSCISFLTNYNLSYYILSVYCCIVRCAGSDR